MEIKNQLEQCPNGHYYNSALHPTCPICAQGSIPATEPFPATSAPGGTYMADSPYMAENPGFPRTEPVSVDRSVSTPSTPFQPTMIGGDLNVPGGVEPVVGWLVCVLGSQQGLSFPLSGGRNRIGRSADMDVCLSSDPEVSRNMHCILTFDPASEAFYLQAGDGRGLTYLNGTLLLTPMQLKPHDLIRVGATTLLFVPLCGESFHWNTYFQMP